MPTFSQDMFPNLQRWIFNRRFQLFGLIVLQVLYLPTIFAPFDFEDDAAAFQSISAEQSLLQRIDLAWLRTVEDVRTVGPFRPAYWGFLELHSYLFGEEVLYWRLSRALILGISYWLFATLMMELGLPVWASVFAAAFSLVAPLRSQVWYHLQFGESWAMPVCLLALLAAHRARLNRANRWDALAVLCLIVAVFIKNVFVSVAPAALLLRLWSDERTLGKFIRFGALYLAVAALPLAQVIYFKTHVESTSRYQAAAPTFNDTINMIRAVALASGYDFLVIGVAISALGLLSHPRCRACFVTHGKACALAGALLAGGILIYLPVLGGVAPAGRYTMPACWGADLLMGCLLVGVSQLPAGHLRRLCIGTLIAGTFALVAVNVGQQIEFASRSRQLWEAVSWFQKTDGSQNVLIQDKALGSGETFHFATAAGIWGQKKLQVSTDQNLPAGPAWILTRTPEAPADGAECIRVFPTQNWLAMISGKRSRRSSDLHFWKVPPQVSRQESPTLR